MNSDDMRPIQVDAETIHTLAATNGLALTLERASDLAPAVQAILDADAQIAALDLGALPTTGLPWPEGAESEFDGRR